MEHTTDDLRALPASDLLGLGGGGERLTAFIREFHYLGFQYMTHLAALDHQEMMNGIGHDMAGTELSTQIETLRRDVCMWCDALESLDYGDNPDKDDSPVPKPACA